MANIIVTSTLPGTDDIIQQYQLSKGHNWTPFWFTPSEDDTNTNVAEFPASFLPTLQSWGRYANNSTSTKIDLNVWVNRLRERTEMKPGDYLFLDFEPERKWKVLHDTSISAEEKRIMFEAFRKVYDATCIARPDLKMGGLYGLFPEGYGRNHAAGDKMVGVGLSEFNRNPIDNAPLLREKSFYPTRLTWAEIEERAITANEFVRECMGFDTLRKITLVLYPTDVMAENNGTLFSWELFLDNLLSHVPEGYECFGWFRRWFLSGALHGSVSSTNTMPFSEQYFRGMMKLAHEKLDHIILYAHGNNPITDNLGNGLSFADYIRFAVEERK